MLRGPWRAWLPSLLGLALATLAAVLAACSSSSDGTPANVPASFGDVRESPGHKRHLGKDKVTCQSCHAYERDGFKDPGPEPCKKCHDKEAARPHAGDADQKTECTTCHAFKPRITVPACASCHDKKRGELPAVVSHRTTECKECHTTHASLPGTDGGPAVKSCDPCHKERAPSHAKHAGSTGCSDCHKPHAAGKDALAGCASSGCHQKANRGPIGHDGCTSCHKPHQLVANGKATCEGCHGKKPTLSSGAVASHAVCTSCHAPHAPTRAAAWDSCTPCHAGVKVEHAGHTACSTCHAVHQSEPAPVATTCTSCHAKNATSDHAGHAGKTPCTTCHKPHGFKLAAGALCGTCHAKELRLTQTNRNHAACTACHGEVAHRPTRGAECASCHTKELASAPSGHRACASCHEDHSGATKAAATCTSCHAAEAKSHHAKVTGGCQSCHRPHGPNGTATAPSCATCHPRQKLPALHATQGHADCTQCHSSHGPSRADRATCTKGCHTSQASHQTAAPTCNGCHVFRQ